MMYAPGLRHLPLPPVDQVLILPLGDAVLVQVREARAGPEVLRWFGCVVVC